MFERRMKAEFGVAGDVFGEPKIWFATDYFHSPVKLIIAVL
jgi:hypothetical protein